MIYNIIKDKFLFFIILGIWNLLFLVQDFMVYMDRKYIILEQNIFFCIVLWILQFLSVEKIDFNNILNNGLVQFDILDVKKKKIIQQLS